MYTVVFLLRGALGLGGVVVAVMELTRQASGPGWRGRRLCSAVAAVLLAALLAV
ncbi:hypothetical protein ACFZAU_28325 [Streptomyces sp. NPDC008238]